MHIDKWLQDCHDEQTKEASVSMDVLFELMEPEDLIKIAEGQATVDSVLEKMAEEDKRHAGKRWWDRNKGKVIGGTIGHTAGGVLGAVAGRGGPLGGMAGMGIGTLIGHAKDRSNIKADPKLQRAPKTKTKTSEAKFMFMDKVAREIAHMHYEVEKEAAEKKKEFTRGGKWWNRNKSKILGTAIGGAAGIPIGSALGGAAGALIGRSPEAAHAGAMLGQVPGHLGGAGLGALIGRSKDRKRVAADERLQGPKDKGMVKKDEFTSPEAQQKAKAMQTAMSATKGAPPAVAKGAVKHMGQKLASINKESGSKNVLRRIKELAEKVTAGTGSGTKAQRYAMGRHMARQEGREAAKKSARAMKAGQPSKAIAAEESGYNWGRQAKAIAHKVLDKG